MTLVLSRAARELFWGPGIGLVFAFAVSRALAATLENVPVAGPDVFVIIVVTISAGAMLAMWKPIRRVAQLSPLDALRER